MINSIISDIISTVNSQLLSTADIDSLLLDNYFHDSQRELAPLTQISIPINPNQSQTNLILNNQLNQSLSTQEPSQTSNETIQMFDLARYLQMQVRRSSLEKKEQKTVKKNWKVKFVVGQVNMSQIEWKKYERGLKLRSELRKAKPNQDSSMENLLRAPKKKRRGD